MPRRPRRPEGESCRTGRESCSSLALDPRVRVHSRARDDARLERAGRVSALLQRRADEERHLHHEQRRHEHPPGDARAAEHARRPGGLVTGRHAAGVHPLPGQRPGLDRRRQQRRQRTAARDAALPSQARARSGPARLRGRRQCLVHARRPARDVLARHRPCQAFPRLPVRPDRALRRRHHRHRRQRRARDPAAGPLRRRPGVSADVAQRAPDRLRAPQLAAAASHDWGGRCS